MLDVLTRDLILESEYAFAKQARAIVDLNDLSHWPEGLAERFTRRIEIIRSWGSSEENSLWSNFELRLVSSWIDGSGVDEFTHQEEPDFWELKTAHKTWGGRFPEKMKHSDFDINIHSILGTSVSVTGLWDLDDQGQQVRIDVYPSKGERSITL